MRSSWRRLIAAKPCPPLVTTSPRVVHVDVVPAGEAARHPFVDHRVGVLDAAERLVGEDDAEAVRVVGRVALPDRDLAARVELLGQSGEVEPAGAAADDRDAQRSRIPGHQRATISRSR